MPGTCLGVIPIEAGVVAIGVIQLVFESSVLGMYIHAGLEQREMGFYIEFVLRSLGVLGAILLLLGIGTKTHQMFVPWMLMTVMQPAVFMLSLFSSLFFLQFHAAANLLMSDGIQSLVVFYCCIIVYELYVMMEAEERCTLFPDSRTLYGTSNVNFTIASEEEEEEMNRRRRARQDLPPSYSAALPPSYAAAVMEAGTKPDPPAVL